MRTGGAMGAIARMIETEEGVTWDDAARTSKPGMSPEGRGQMPGTRQSSSLMVLDVTVGWSRPMRVNDGAGAASLPNASSGRLLSSPASMVRTLLCEYPRMWRAPRKWPVDRLIRAVRSSSKLPGVSLTDAKMAWTRVKSAKKFMVTKVGAVVALGALCAGCWSYGLYSMEMPCSCSEDYILTALQAKTERPLYQSWSKIT